MTNGGAVEIVVEFPFMLNLVEAFLGFFRRIFTHAQPLRSLDPYALLHIVVGLAQ